MRRFWGACLLLLALATLASGLSETDETNVAEVHPDSGVVLPVIASHLRDTRAADKEEKKRKPLKQKKKRTRSQKKKTKTQKKKGQKKEKSNKKTANRKKKVPKKKRKVNVSKRKGKGKMKKSNSSRRKDKQKTNKRKKKNEGSKKKSTKQSKRKLRQKLRKGRKKKSKKNRKKSKDRERQTTAVSGNCNNVTCLNNILLVLKIDKDTVQNYMQQKKRMDARLNLGANKAGKKAFMNETLRLLVSSFGGETALKRKAPICAGRYNSTKANDGAKLLRNLSRCESQIAEACTFSLPNGTSDKMEVCNAAMLDYRVKVNMTKEKGTLNCSNWQDLMTKIPQLQKCNSGNSTSAKTNEKAMKDKMDQCKLVTSFCKGWEDQSMAYIATCKTSSNNLKKILFALYKSKEKLTKVNTKVTSALNKATKEGRNKRSFGRL